jgi:transforming growth factor-beta-induced protein
MLRLVVPLLGLSLLSAPAFAELLNPAASPLSVAAGFGDSSAETAPIPRLAPRNAVERADLMNTLEAAGRFKTFVKLVQAAGMAPTLESRATFTVFAPTDEAFERMPSSDLGELESPPHKAELQRFIAYHIVPGEVTLANMSGRQEVAALQGGALIIQATMDNVRINDADIVKGDIIASNGVVHAIDRVLTPPLAADERIN